MTRTEVLRNHLEDQLKAAGQHPAAEEVDYILAAIMDHLHEQDCALTGTGVRHFKHPVKLEVQVA